MSECFSEISILSVNLRKSSLLLAHLACCFEKEYATSGIMDENGPVTLVSCRGLNSFGSRRFERCFGSNPLKRSF